MLLDLNNIEFKRIDKFIHIYYIPRLHDYLLSFKDEFIEGFNRYKQSNDEGSVNFPIEKPDIYNIFECISQNYYLLEKSWHIQKLLGIYVQNHSNNISLYHNHLPYSLASTTYLNPPLKNEGGEIQFYLHETNQIKILPQKDCIYFFPGWMMHRPLLQTTSKERICINWAYDSSKRPIHKLTGDRW